MSSIRNLVRDPSGATAIEYSLIACLIALAIIISLQLVGTQISTVFGEAGNALK